MPKRIVILDPNGVEVANEPHPEYVNNYWDLTIDDALANFGTRLRRNPKLGTYTVTVKEIGDD